MIRFAELKENSHRGYLFDKNKSKRFYLKNDVTIIGRKSNEVNMIIADPYVGRRHCRIEEKDGNWQLKDLGSKNGTAVNGTRIDAEWYLLKDNDIITMGKTELVFRTETDEDCTM